MSRHRIGAVLVAALVLSLGASGCGQPKSTPSASAAVLKDCRDQWHDVAESVVGMDQDANPSALASRWTSVLATIDYYETSSAAEKNCQADIETQVKANSLLRQFSERLRPYDMQYQLGRVNAAADLYLHDPLPAATRNAHGNQVKPPSKAAVTAALQTLTTGAVAANAELQPGWGQLASVELTDAAAVTSALGDLDSLAQDSPAWKRCEQALQVLVAAVAAQEGALGAPTP